MSPLKTPVGHMIISNYRTPGNLKDQELQNNLEYLVETVKQHVAQKGIAKAFPIVEGYLSKVHIDLLAYVKKHPDFVAGKSDMIVNEAEANYVSTGIYSKINAAVSDTLGIWQMFGNKHKKASQNQLQLQSINEDLFESSVRYDFYLMIAGLLPDETLFVNADELNLLPAQLRNALVDYGSYAALSGIWQPLAADESQLIRNIKIKTAALSLQRGLGQKASVESLHSLLH